MKWNYIDVLLIVHFPYEVQNFDHRKHLITNFDWIHIIVFFFRYKWMKKNSIIRKQNKNAMKAHQN